MHIDFADSACRSTILEVTKPRKMGKNKSKAPKGRAGAKQKAKKGGSGGWTHSSPRNGGYPQYGWSDDDGIACEGPARSFLC